MSQNKHNSWSPTVPPDEKKIWRYRDFAQFLSILEQGSLWFNRADLFPDTFEGSFTRMNVETRHSRYKETEIPEEVVEMMSPMAENFRETVYLNCWHLNDHESAAMWDLYLPAEKGIAIQSTVGRFREAINSADNGSKIEKDTDDGEPEELERMMKIGEVDYIDYSSELIPENNLYAPIYHKRASYQHEQEFRAAFSEFSDLMGDDDGIRVDADFVAEPGYGIKINLSKLIESVHVAPSSPDWFLEVLSQVIDRYDESIEIQRSNLDEDPVF